MKIHEPPMTFLNEQMATQWGVGLKNQTSPYGEAIYRYASEWATRMEAKMAELKIGRMEQTHPEIHLKQVEKFMKGHASKISHEADNEGITGFMYGAAVSVLSGCWKHGEALRRWHNLDTQLGDEGEKANEEGGVLNPALLNIR